MKIVRNSRVPITGPSIRFFICGVICLWTGLPVQAATGETQNHTLNLGDGLYVFRYGAQQSLFLVGADRVIATDPQSVEAAKAYKAAVKAVTDKPITHVAYTSSFFDRVPGGRELAGQGAEFVAQANCKTNLEATPHPDAVVPTQTYTDQLSIDAGNASLDLYYFGQSYGTCLSVMIFKPANIMWVHGLVTPPVAKVPDDPTIASYYLHNLVPFFVEVEELAAAEGVEQVVGSVAVRGEDEGKSTSTPGTRRDTGKSQSKDKGTSTSTSTSTTGMGASTSTGKDQGKGNDKDQGTSRDVLAPVSLITEQRVFWDTLLDIVETEYNKGTPARAIPKKTDMSPLEDYAGYDPRHVEIMMRRIYSLYRIGR